MKNRFHQELLNLIVKNSGKPTQHTFLDAYLGNDHLRYPIDNPTLRKIARVWMRSHKDLERDAFVMLLTSLIEGESCTEKMMAGFLLEYSANPQRTFHPAIFDEWLDHLVGWVEIDTLCAGDFVRTELPLQWPKWKKLILRLSKDANINKRRAALVLFCSPITRVKVDDMAEVALKVVERLKSEKEVIITKAVSWVLRSMIKHHRAAVDDYLAENVDTLPRIAVRETRAKLTTGRKTVKRQS
jgi:3-methyladenine DNA glycosylase AlkD